MRRLSGIRPLVARRSSIYGKTLAELAVSTGAEPVFALAGRWRVELENLVEQLYFSGSAPAPHVLSMGAPHHLRGSGKLCAHVADILAARVPDSVCVVETAAAPSAVEALGLSVQYGWHDLIRNSDVDRSDALIQASRSNLWVLPAGQRRIPVFRRRKRDNAERVRTRVDDLRRQFEFIVIDGSSDMIGFASCSDAVVIVVQQFVTRLESARSLKTACEAAGTPIPGFAFLETSPTEF